ncbi:hypothetical protein NC653_022650 [Populus alba x Populus x berolinensis]|uniref:Uncharacterized protein n=1 Tax=Populus alba x Populus x berolinensis TaxID=444605 RepID=A0AAD6MFE5_9ROSI|nr:hypothetical protein NC653_022650 [Populus alba x Populus x berolinensis]
METTSVLLHSKTIPFSFTISINNRKRKLSFRHHDKHLQSHLSNTSVLSGQNLKPIKIPLNPPFSLYLSTSSLKITGTHLLSPPKCSYSGSVSTEGLQTHQFLKPFKNLSLVKLKATLLQLTPVDIIKWSAILSTAIAATKWTVNLLLKGQSCTLFLVGGSMWGFGFLILATLLMQYNSTFYLAKYSEKVVVPSAVVQFGPYRWKAKMEEGLMIETFGEKYLEYMSKVQYKFIPLVY